jgi:glycosyltransferase involved in cell wall biosynthesis
MVHELFPDAFSRLDDTSDQKRAAVDRADHVICISYNTQRDLLQLFGTDKRKVSVVHLGHDPLSSNAEVPKKLSDGKPYILYVANRNSYKNFTCLLQAYSMASSIRRDYRIVAFGGGALTAKERVTMADFGVSDDDVVQISGTDEVLAGTYKGASAFVYPSLYEGFGLSPLEAMGLGCPVVSSSASCMPEILGDAAEYFDPGSAVELASALERVLGDEARSGALRALGYVQAERFTWAETARKTSDIYRSVVASR